MVLDLRDLDRTKIAIAGGKAANLGELCKINGVNVPNGFCITTDVFKEYRATKKIREDVIQQVTARIEENVAYAVRSSATAEDLPTASFAGQHDTYLNIVGADGILKHVVQCWDSLYTDRAKAYRAQNNFDDGKVSIAVIVQKMVPAQVSGIMFTADPLTSNRKMISIEATPGLGEALVSGLTNSDSRLLTDNERKELEGLGRKIEAHFGAPQDMEWCLANGKFYIVQSRPITTLYPIPERADRENHVYLSVGHQQMMTDAMKPLGLTMWQAMSAAPMFKAGGRLFVDVTLQLSSVAGRTALLSAMGQHDPLIKGALETIIDRNFIPLTPPKDGQPPKNYADVPPIENDVAIVDALIKRWETSLEELKEKIKSRSGVGLIDFIRDDIPQFRKDLSDVQSMSAIMAAINASVWLNEKMKEWLGEKNVSDVLSQSLANNITSQMGLDLLDVADAVREHDSGEAINSFLNKYGMRGVGEIDITRPRWAEDPTALMSLVQSNIRNFKPGESKRRFEKGLREARQKEQELLARLRQLPGGDEKAEETKRNISILRTFAGYREYPKYGIISRYFVYKLALLKEVQKLVDDNVIREKDDVYYLTFDELREVVRGRTVDYNIIEKRKEEQKFFEKLTPPRVITSDGEVVSGQYKTDHIPKNAIAGLAVSSGVVEGRARVILNIENADLDDGDILVTRFTDPSWTPLFVSIKGLVTEVGGLMTHGAVIAREYGLPAVVGIENATALVKDGQRIRVNGTDGYIEVL